MRKVLICVLQVVFNTISSLRTTKRGADRVKNRHHTDRPRKTPRREDIDKVTSFRRNRFLSIVRIHGLVRIAMQLGFVKKKFKDD